MKKIFKILVLIIVFIGVFLLVKNYYINDYKVEVLNQNFGCSLKFKGLKNARDFTGDEEGNFYIAYADRIQFVGNNGESYNIINDSKLIIESIEYYKNKLYFVSQNSLYCTNLITEELEIVINDLPNFGDWYGSKLAVNDNFLYLSIGATTNSGVVGDDDLWLSEYPYGHDISPYMITLKGFNFGDKETGAFLNYGSQSIQGQIVTGHFPGNASIVVYNLETGDAATFAWGIRNVGDMDFDSRSKLIATVGGMENRGLRPIIGDVDYIYEIEEKKWYGWPDYSGGDPVNSPRFKGANDKRVPFVLDKHPSTNPPAPMYQHEEVNSLTCLAVDSLGTIGNVDTIYFLDKNTKILFSIDNQGVLNEVIAFSDNSFVRSLNYINGEMLFIDTNSGYMYNLAKLDNANMGTIKIKITYWLIIVLIVVISIYLLATIKNSIKK